MAIGVPPRFGVSHLFHDLQRGANALQLLIVAVRRTANEPDAENSVRTRETDFHDSIERFPAINPGMRQPVGAGECQSGAIAARVPDHR